MSYNLHYKDKQSKVIALTVTWTDILDSSGQKSFSEKGYQKRIWKDEVEVWQDREQSYHLVK